MKRQRLDRELVTRGMAETRSQAENYIKLGFVTIKGGQVSKPGLIVGPTTDIKLSLSDKYVSRAAYKLASVAKALRLDFKDKTVLDVGSSTGGFTDFVLQNGAKKVIAVDVGTDQMHPSLREDKRIELHEQTDIRDFKTHEKPDIIMIDVSFISLRDILPHISRLITHSSVLIAMAKPQFEAGKSGQKHHGIIKNNRVRRTILKDLEIWIQKLFVISDKADSEVAGSKGNVERFYLLKKLKTRH